ncbi:hypothetical protein AcW1_002056 [Taiwanofungus camphoratus]|nr:hypothetical protein AcW1_002056 [Antrodia cinnamomea]KAI0945957.1 hypothetical protein AcV7_010062 [Antrodia cinnamomea]
MAPNVLLLRTPARNDQYESAFQSRGYTAISVPVLETVFRHLDELKKVMQNGPEARGYDGVVVTSGRSCEAWKTVALELVSESTSVETSSSVDWSVVPFYVVGEATAKSLADVQEAIGDYFSPKDIRGASESGTSERLAHFILKDLASMAGSKKLLYLTGDKNRDTLPKILNDGGFTLEAVQVYATQGSATFASDLDRALRSAPPGSHTWWITFFAPSESEFVTPILRKHFDFPSGDKPPALGTPKIAAIGPTTSGFLQENLNLQVHVVSPKPNAESLSTAIVSFDAEHVTQP